MDHFPFRDYILGVDDFIEFLQRMRDFRMHSEFNTGKILHEMFRGEARLSWKIRPTIARKIIDADTIRDIEKKMILEFHDILVEQSLSNKIQSSFLPHKYHTEWLLIQQAQHYKLPTRFIDWTNRWEVAMFFAVSEKRFDNYHGKFWIYLVPDEFFSSDYNPEYLNHDPFDYNRGFFLNSSGFLGPEYLTQIAQRRKTRQFGKFFIQGYNSCIKPLESQKIHKRNLWKLTIPKYVKSEIRHYLADQNYTEETLYVAEEEQVAIIVKQLRAKYGV